MIGTLAALGDLGCCIGPFFLVGLVLAGFVFLMINGKIPGGLGRGRKMQPAAAQLGCTYIKSTPYTSIPAAASLHLFINGSGHRIANVISGTRDGVQMSLFDHQFHRPFSSRRIFVHTVVVAAPGFALPVFVLRPPAFLHNLGVAPVNPITFPDHPKFSSQFVLMGADADAIRRIFTPAVIEFCEMRPGLCLETVSEYLFLFRQGVLAPPQNLGIYLDETNTLLRLFAAALAGVHLQPPPMPPVQP